MARQKPAKERRIHKRIKSSVGTEVDLKGKTDYTHLRNISRGGAYIYSFADAPYRVGQDVVVGLPSKKQEKIRLISRIVWEEEDGIGVKFVALKSGK